jgi:hypothetical protein
MALAAGGGSQILKVNRPVVIRLEDGRSLCLEGIFAFRRETVN